uniref:Uncharacterized protein n=1 Tax=Eutreptiella gymnastica TaxID=73025 RepID=A0A7S1IZ15_9EUGL
MWPVSSVSQWIQYTTTFFSRRYCKAAGLSKYISGPTLRAKILGAQGNKMKTRCYIQQINEEQHENRTSWVEIKCCWLRIERNIRRAVKVIRRFQYSSAHVQVQTMCNRAHGFSSPTSFSLVPSLHSQGGL